MYSLYRRRWSIDQTVIVLYTNYLLGTLGYLSGIVNTALMMNIETISLSEDLRTKLAGLLTTWIIYVLVRMDRTRTNKNLNHQIEP